FSREQKLEDSTLGWRCINPVMQARYGVDSMTQTADNLARERGIARACQDAYAWRSQQRTAHAQARGWLAEEITSVRVRKGSEIITVSEDEHPRPNITPEHLAKLKPLLGAGGARLVMTAAYALRRQQQSRALVSLCVGVGQGVALALERA